MRLKCRVAGAAPTWFCSHNLLCGFLLFIKGKEAAKIKFRQVAASRADTAGCQEQFKLAVLLTKQHRNKQFNHSSQNMSWHVVTFHWERVTLFLFLCVCEELLEVAHQSCELAVERGKSSMAHLLLFSEPLLSVAPIKCECPRWRLCRSEFNKYYTGGLFVFLYTLRRK